jgi:hypothetical protein
MQQSRKMMAAKRIPAALFICRASFRSILRKLPFLTSITILTTPACQNNGQILAIGGIGNDFGKRVTYCFQRRSNHWQRMHPKPKLPWISGKKGLVIMEILLISDNLTDRISALI